MAAEHTPGPWSVVRASCDDNGDVRYVLDGIKEAKAADARLIAAAPDLLEALKATVASWERHYSKFPVDETIEDDEFGAFQSARAAIAKALGSDVA